MKTQSFPITLHVEVDTLDDEAQYHGGGNRPLKPEDVRYIAAQALKDVLSKAFGYEGLSFIDENHRVEVNIRGISVAGRGRRTEVAGRKRSR